MAGQEHFHFIESPFVNHVEHVLENWRVPFPSKKKIRHSSPYNAPHVHGSGKRGHVQPNFMPQIRGAQQNGQRQAGIGNAR